MKSYLTLFILISAILTSRAATQRQVDTTDFFPSEIGNYWEYKCDATPETESGWWKITIVSDTLMPHGRYNVKFRKQTFDDSGKLLQIDEYCYRKDSNGVYAEDSECPTGEYKLFDLTPGLKDSTIWETCRKVYHSYTICRGMRIFYTKQFSPLQKSGDEARLFVDVAVDSTENSEIWGPLDNSKQIVLVKGLGIVYESCVSCYSPYYLMGAIINGKQFGTITSVENERSIIPSSMRIQAYPNPFNSTIRLNVDLKSAGITELMVFNILGQKVATIFEDYKPSGNFKFSFNADHLSSGVYFVLLKQGRLFCKEKIILLK